MKRAGQVIVAAMIASASATSVAAQDYYARLLEAYERSMRPLTYMRGRLNPYVHRKADFFGGIDMAKATAFAWAGATWSPQGALVEDGWRVRFMGGAGRYSYATNSVPGGINDANLFSGELLGGYRKTFDGIFGTKIFAAAFAGIFYESQLLHMPDAFHLTQGNDVGIKGSLELYARIREQYIVTAFGSVASVHQKYYAKATVLHELTERWGIGGEFATMGDARYTENRIGLAGSFTWERRIISLSVGALENSGRGSGSYLTFSVYSPL